MKPARSLPPSAVTKPAPTVTSADVQLYMPLVRQCAARFLRKVPSNVLRDDLVAAGTVGLLDALRKNGEDRGPTFEWYARTRIRGAVLDELRTQDWLTRRDRDAARASVNGAPATPAAVVGIDDLSEARREALADDSFPSPDAALEGKQESEALERAVGALPERLQGIVRQHYLGGVAFKDIAASMGVSEPRVSQLHSRAVKVLREIMATNDAKTAAA